MNCAVIRVKDDWKNCSEAWAIACQNCSVYSVFPSDTTPHSKIAQINREFIGRLRQHKYIFSNCSQKCFLARDVLQLHSKMFHVVRDIHKFVLRPVTEETPNKCDQWNESHAVTQPDVFDKVCKFSPNDRHRDIKGTPTHALQVNCILLSGRLYSQAHTVSIADWWYHQYASY